MHRPCNKAADWGAKNNRAFGIDPVRAFRLSHAATLKPAQTAHTETNLGHNKKGSLGFRVEGR